MLLMREFYGDCDLVSLLQRLRRDDSPWRVGFGRKTAVITVW